jgi:hypothetical protein
MWIPPVDAGDWISRCRCYTLLSTPRNVNVNVFDRLPTKAEGREPASDVGCLSARCAPCYRSENLPWLFELDEAPSTDAGWTENHCRWTQGPERTGKGRGM